MAFDFDQIDGLERGATFLADGDISPVEFLQDGYVYNEGDTFECPNPFPFLPPIISRAAWTPPGVDTRSLLLRTETTWDTSGLVPADDIAKEGLTDETPAAYAGRIGTPDFLTVTGFGTVEYQTYFVEECPPDTEVDPDSPSMQIALHGDGGAFAGYLPLGVNAEGLPGQGALNVAIARPTPIYAGDPTNDATLCLFTWAEFQSVVLSFDPGYVAHILRNSTGDHHFNVRTYFLLPTAAPWMCVL